MIHILIERHIANNMESTYDEVARTALQHSHRVPGFISGEAYTDSNNPSHRFLICKWRTNKDWETWQKSSERLELTNKFSSILEQPERVVILRG